MFTPSDTHHMQHAIRVAKRHVGNTGHRPSVGCVLVNDGQVIAAACTGLDGSPHAEAAALELAGKKATGATAYVTLEPCAHHGRTPPCAEALIAANIARVVIACTDPDSRVSGKGIAMLEAAGIAVEVGLCEGEAAQTLAGFFKYLSQKAPYITLKLATSADGMMAVREGENPIITGDMARNRGQLLRSQHDAILTGIGTVLADDPLLTCRLSGLESRAPIRIVLDRDGRLPANCQLVKTTSEAPVWIIGNKEAAKNNISWVRHPSAGWDPCAHHPVPSDNLDSGLRWSDDFSNILNILAERNITRLMIEAGPTLTRAFLESGLVDEVQHFQSPNLLQPIANPNLPLLDIPAITEAKNLNLQLEETLGNDVLKVYKGVTPFS